MLVFSICLITSAFFWVITAFSKNCQTTLTIPVVFTNLPKDKILIGELPKELALDVKASGLKLFVISLKKSMQELVVDFSSLKKLKENVYSFSASNNFYLAKTISSDIEVIHVKPDSLYFTFNNSFFKSVPIKADVMVDFEQMYNLAEQVKVSPAFVIISGDSSLVKKIDTVFTEKVILSSLNKSVKQKASLIFTEDYGKNLYSSVSEVSLEINIDKFTDSEIEIPITVINPPIGVRIKTFPERVKIKYQVGMNSYEKITASQFKAVINFKNSNQIKNYIKIELELAPSNIRNIKIFPEKAEFLLKK